MSPPLGSLPSGCIALYSELPTHLKACSDHVHDGCVQAFPLLLGCVHDLAGQRMVTWVNIYVNCPEHLPRNGYYISFSGKSLLKSAMN